MRDQSPLLCFTVLAALLSAACGTRSDASRNPESEPRQVREPSPEECNQLDDDLDLRVDEDFRDEAGRYVDNDHCGACGRPCRGVGGNVLAAQCALIDEVPTCAATQCRPGFAVNALGACVDISAKLCLTCLRDEECGAFEGASCAQVGSSLRCVIACDLGCPDGYACDAVTEVCRPSGGACDCDEGQNFELACSLTDPEGNRCAGEARCEDGVLTECTAPEERCDGVDNNCDGVIDEGFRDALANYNVDPRHCGACGVDCTADVALEDITCGGDAFAPSCVLRCPEGLADADRNLENGCECTISSPTEDAPGPVRSSGSELDPNCDGADGVVTESFYVATDGDDAGPGSPTRPLRTLGMALIRAAESLDTATPRAHIFLAAGTYTESVEVPDGVRVHGGYRRDFLALDPNAFRVDLRAPSQAASPGGAAMIFRGAGVTTTLVEWMVVTGVDAEAASAPAFGMILEDPGPLLTLRDMSVRAGLAGRGVSGAAGAAGSSGGVDAESGRPQRSATEGADRECLVGSANVNAGGAPGRNRCDGQVVDGGVGGAASCPNFGSVQGSGSGGSGVSSGQGGIGGVDTRGPIIGGPSCPGSVCCGLPDFTVSVAHGEAEPGRNGSAGTLGQAGAGCTDSVGTLESLDTLRLGTALPGGGGSPGSGGGGGGAGSSVAIRFVAGACELPDGLGGSGGGGGAGGCGGQGGQAGTSGGPSVAVVIRYTSSAVASTGMPTLENIEIFSGSGGDGGVGGAGGDGGPGGAGGLGGALPDIARSSLSLAAAFGGREGGRGGEGGDGGGGGGGCGGASLGIWMTGLGPSLPPELAQSIGQSVTQWRGTNLISLGEGGRGGRGGGGAVPAADGVNGEVADVLVR